MSRDPRVDPKPGDLVKPRGEWRPFRVVEVTAEGCIHGHYDPSYLPKRMPIGSLCCLPYWRKWAKDAEVIHHAAD